MGNVSTSLLCIGVLAGVLSGCSAPWTVARRPDDVGLRQFADSGASHAAPTKTASSAAPQVEQDAAARLKAPSTAEVNSQPTAPSEPPIDRTALVAELARLLVEEKRKHQLDDAAADARPEPTAPPYRAPRGFVDGQDSYGRQGYSSANPEQRGASGLPEHDDNVLRIAHDTPYEIQHAYARHPSATDWNDPRLTAMNASAPPLTYPSTGVAADVRTASHVDPLPRDPSTRNPSHVDASRVDPRESVGQQPATGANDHVGPVDHAGSSAAAGDSKLSPREFQAALDEVVGLLEAKLKSATLGEEERARGEVALRLLRLASERPGDWTKASAAISQLEKSEQEFWTHLLFGLHVFLDAASTPRMKQRAKLALIELRDAEGRLANLGELEVRNLAFCTEVRSYGVYTEFTENRFQPGQEVILYAEVDNFAAEEKKGGFETSMEGTCEVYSAAGQQVHVHKFDPDTELCRNRRRDFFLPYHYWLPDDLPAGEYSLKLTIKDRKANKMDQGTIKFTVEGRR